MAGITKTLTRVSHKRPNGIRNIERPIALGSAEQKYQRNGETPHSELLFKTVLNQKTSASGQTGLFQNIESTPTVSIISPIAAGTAVFISLENKEEIIDCGLQVINHTT